jgi:hypothetical protein
MNIKINYRKLEMRMLNRFKYSKYLFFHSNQNILIRSG